MTHETQAAFAKRLGVTRSYVNKLKESGRLVITEGSLVDVEASLAAIQATQDPSKPSHVIPPPAPTSRPARRRRWTRWGEGPPIRRRWRRRRC